MADQERFMRQQFGQVVNPLSQLGSTFLEGAEKMVDYQFEMMRTYTHFAVGQMRDALEVHDPESLREFLDKRREAAEELSRKLSEGCRRAKTSLAPWPGPGSGPASRPAKPPVRVPSAPARRCAGAAARRPSTITTS